MMNSINLEIVAILEDKPKPRHVCKVRIKKPDLVIWLPVEVIPSQVLISYCRQLLSKKRGYDISLRIYELLAVSKDEELNRLLKEFRSVTGLQLPSSKYNDILIRLRNLIGKIVYGSELANIRRDILIEKIIDKRKSLSINLKKAEMQINLISDNEKPIKIRNEYDLEQFPAHLRYVNKSIPYSEAVPENVMVGCACKGSCSSSCSHLDFESEFHRNESRKGFEENQENVGPYDENGKILYPHTKPVFECNRFCECDDSCLRKVVQKGPKIQLEIFRTFNGCGWGVRTLESLLKGTFITKYTGELIPWADGDKRENKEYLFDNDIDFDPKIGHSTYTIDAFGYGNIARFINHNCDPNLSSHVVYIDNMHPEMGEIAFFAQRDIEAYEELSINYIGLVKSSNKRCICSVCCSR